MAETLTRAAPPPPAESPPHALRQELFERFRACGLLRPFRRARYDPGECLDLRVTGVVPANEGRVLAEVERFVGGGFAGQVYRVRLRQVEPLTGELGGLAVGGHYAVKILTPPSGLARRFRDLLFFLAYQGPFSAQANPAAVRTGVLWQKLIRRAAARRFGSERAIVDTYATFYDERLHSFGEINEWVDGRVWKFEVDDRLFARWNFRGQPPEDLAAAEYVHKRLFMRALVGLLREMGLTELARQYEWWTCKSQPNVLKRHDGGSGPGDGLTAIDFRPGLALLPFLPMSPADFRLILRGLLRGSAVQFDRSEPRQFARFLEAHAEDFADLRPAVSELAEQESAYRRSLPDVTHHHVRLITDAELRRSVRAGIADAWQKLGRIDQEHAGRLRRRPGLFTLLYAVMLVPLLGRRVVQLWGDGVYRRHVGRCLRSWNYLCRTLRGARIEALIRWHRAGRVSDERARRLVDRPVRYWLQVICLSWLPAAWHRAIAEPRYAWLRLREKVGFAVRFLRYPVFREEWLLDQVRLGREEGMLTAAEADRVCRQIKDPFIQKYLKSVAVHLCTVPVTQIVSLTVALYVMARFGTSWSESLAYAVGVLAFFQVTPISPGSIVRGSYVVYLIVRERNLRNYWLAALISFWKYVGYLGFPIQMVRQYPALARYMAGRWATGAVRFVPVFGERGALPEHIVFDLFFNLPLSVKRGFQTRPLTATLWALATLATLGVIVYDATVLGLLLYAVIR